VFRIKVCGIRGAADAIAARDAGVDAIGLNFHAPSPRSIDEAAAEAMRRAVPGDFLEWVGVFVNDEPDRIRRVARRAGLNHVQLHGDEDAERIAELAPLSVIRAVRVRDGESLMDAVERTIGTMPPGNLAGLLADFHHDRLFGGSGRSLAWNELGAPSGAWGRVPWILAGGLTPANVAVAVQMAKPHAVDTASGVESAPGNKDSDAMRAFVRAARSAFGTLSE